jgi:Copper resistance protein B precursor (CopB)
LVRCGEIPRRSRVPYVHLGALNPIVETLLIKTLMGFVSSGPAPMRLNSASSPEKRKHAVDSGGRHQVLFRQNFTRFSGPATYSRSQDIHASHRRCRSFATSLLLQFCTHVVCSRWRRVEGRIQGSYDLYLSQRLILQPQVEMNFYSQADPARGIGSGFSGLDSGVRLGYQFSRKFAPYIEYTYTGVFGQTATFSRLAGEATRGPRVVSKPLHERYGD